MKNKTTKIWQLSSKEWLLNNYPLKSSVQIAKEIGTSPATVYRWLLIHDIPRLGAKHFNLNRPAHNKNKKGLFSHTEEFKNNLRERMRTYRHSPKAKKKLSESHKGNRNNFWKGGVTPLSFAIRNLYEYNQWRFAVYKRDKSKCQDCGEKGLEAHHIIPFAKILSDFVREYSQFSPMEDTDTLIRLSVSYLPFWDVSNGVTLCKICHDKRPTINQYASN